MGLELTRRVQARRKPRGRIVVPNSVHPVCAVYAHQQAASIRLSPRDRPSEGWRAEFQIGTLGRWNDATIRSRAEAPWGHPVE
jgi:hypothetical protein